LISVGDIEPVLVLPAGSDADEAREITSAFARLGVRWLHVTRLDMARRLGGVLAAGDVTGICLADAANSSKIADGFIPMTAHVLSQLLMPADGANLPHMRPLHETSDER
jgi:flagellar biosynthesis protein FlhF